MRYSMDLAVLDRVVELLTVACSSYAQTGHCRSS